MADKPHRGTIKNWCRVGTSTGGLGYYIQGTIAGHSTLPDGLINTWNVLKHEGNEIETRNSRYTLEPVS